MAHDLIFGGVNGPRFLGSGKSSRRVEQVFDGELDRFLMPAGGGSRAAGFTPAGILFPGGDKPRRSLSQRVEHPFLFVA